jgi:MHS family proline/betaine transporter-like MFS transporter
MACAPMPALYMELFPTQIRYTGIALSYNLSFALFAGTAPLLAAFSSQLFHSHLAPAAIVMAMAVLSGLCFYFMKESFKQAL